MSTISITASLTAQNPKNHQPWVSANAQLISDASDPSSNRNNAETSYSLKPLKDQLEDFPKEIIYGSTNVTPVPANYSQEQREQRIDAYSSRVLTQIENLESGSEGERNLKFQKTRQFLEPGGYFSGGLLSAGVDPHEKITVTFHTSKGVEFKHETDTEQRTYFAWEIAAGKFAHDKVSQNGAIESHSMSFNTGDRSKIERLEALGSKLQNRWEKDIAKPMRDPASDLAYRSGKADAYVVRGTLQSLVDNPDSFEVLSPEVQNIVTRTLKTNGQVIIPNIYGYPMAGYAFIPHIPYDGNYEHRPNEGLMIDLKNGAVREIHNDNDFARWAKDNRDNVLRSFNASDRQGGKDAHWPPAGEVLDALISGHGHYPGYQNLVKDQAISVSELFNYTRARKAAYGLEYADLNGIAPKYQALNANNSVWADQTEVFGASQQSWKAAKDIWGDTFGYVPVIGTTGNIVFGVHDSIYGMTANDRLGGTAAAVISSLQLAHEITPFGVEAGLGEPPLPATSGPRYLWKYNQASTDVDLVRVPESQTKTTVDEPPRTTGSSGPASRAPKSLQGMREIEFQGKTYFVAHEPDAGDGEHYLLKIPHPDDSSKLASSGIIAKPDEAGVWHRRGEAGGGWWPFRRPVSPTPSEEPKVAASFAEEFIEIDGKKQPGAEKLDEVLNLREGTEYGLSSDNFEVDGVLKRKFKAFWKLGDTEFTVQPAEKAQHTEYGSGEYSSSFVKDINRNPYTITTSENGASVTTHLNASADTAEGIRSARLNQFERAIPDADLRARISEVAHQGSIAPAIIDLHGGTTLKEGYYFGADTTRFEIDYDQTTNTAKVHIVSEGHLSNPDRDISHVPGVQVTIKRTFTIREGNGLESAYEIDKKTPTLIEVSVTPDP